MADKKPENKKPESKKPEAKKPESKMEYKGEKASILMMGTRQKLPGWSGEIFVAVVQYGEKETPKFDVIPDSTNPADMDDLPEVKTFDNYATAVNHFMKLEQNKDKWKKS